MNHIYEWLNEINIKYPPFDVSKWVPPSVRYAHLSIKVLFKTDLDKL